MFSMMETLEGESLFSQGASTGNIGEEMLGEMLMFDGMSNMSGGYGGNNNMFQMGAGLGLIEQGAMTGNVGEELIGDMMLINGMRSQNNYPSSMYNNYGATNVAGMPYGQPRMQASYIAPPVMSEAERLQRAEQQALAQRLEQERLQAQAQRQRQLDEEAQRANQARIADENAQEQARLANYDKHIELINRAQYAASYPELSANLDALQPLSPPISRFSANNNNLPLYNGRHIFSAVLGNLKLNSPAKLDFIQILMNRYGYQPYASCLLQSPLVDSLLADMTYLPLLQTCYVEYVKRQGQGNEDNFLSCEPFLLSLLIAQNYQIKTLLLHLNSSCHQQLIRADRLTAIAVYPACHELLLSIYERLVKKNQFLSSESENIIWQFSSNNFAFNERVLTAIKASSSIKLLKYAECRFKNVYAYQQVIDRYYADVATLQNLRCNVEKIHQIKKIADLAILNIRKNFPNDEDPAQTTAAKTFLNPENKSTFWMSQQSAIKIFTLFSSNYFTAQTKLAEKTERVHVKLDM